MKRLSIKKLLQMFPTESDCIAYYIQYRYKDHRPACHHCGSTHVYQYHSRPKFFKCADCNNTFSIFTNTIFEKTHLDFRVWFYAIQFLINSKKGISAYQLVRYWDMTYFYHYGMSKGDEDTPSPITTFDKLSQKYKIKYIVHNYTD